MSLKNPISFLYKRIKKFFRTNLKKIIQLIIQISLTLADILRITSFESNINRGSVFNRTLVLLDEAKKRGLKTKVLKIGSFQTRFFQIYNHKKKVFFDSLPLGNSYLSSSQRLAENKWRAKIHMQEHGLPVSKGKVFRHVSSALNYAKKIGWPVVVKPPSSSLSQYTNIDIDNKTDLIKAIKEAKKHENTFLVEEQLNGYNYRILIINNKIIGGLLRHPPFVIGDGKSTIKKLVENKNQNPLRGKSDQPNTTLHKITFNEEKLIFLLLKKLTPESIPKKGEKVILHHKINTSSGADLYDVTEKIHSDNRQIFIRCAEIFDAKVLGIDFIAPDISKSYKNQRCGIIEVNTMPYIDMHHHPLKGKSRNASGALLDLIFINKIK